MNICDYGCEKEAKYKFKNGKWCCSKSYNSCSTSRIEKKKRAVERYKNVFEREKQSKRMKKVFLDPKIRKEISKRQKQRFSNIEERSKHSRILKETYKQPEVLQKIRRSIVKIKKKYPTFFNEEEMRYNSTDLNKEEIQVRCKNSTCQNSKEKRGWFTPTSRQIEWRIYCLEHKDGNDGGYFYCSEKCKLSCCLYRFRNDPILLPKFERYKNIVYKETAETLKIYKDKIRKINRRSRELQLDHKYSIYEGFINDVDPKIISHWKNLEVIPASVNASKQSKCSITLEELQDLIGTL